MEARDIHKNFIKNLADSSESFCPMLWNARTSNEVQRVENLNIDPDILIKFNIDLREWL